MCQKRALAGRRLYFHFVPKGVISNPLYYRKALAHVSHKNILRSRQAFAPNAEVANDPEQSLDLSLGAAAVCPQPSRCDVDFDIATPPQLTLREVREIVLNVMYTY